jgi:hypothetical protein
VDRSARPDDGSPARLIAIMVGIVGILLLGSLAWSAVGAMFSALGEATSSLSTGRPTPTRLTALIGTPTIAAARTPVSAETSAPTPPAADTPTPPIAPTLILAPTAAASGRAPWILLPQPAPESRVTPGPLVIEARGRGDTPIAAIRLDLDGVPLAVSLEQRSESTWRGVANTKVGTGHHAVRATVVDEEGRTGGFRWTFEAGP